VAAKTEVRELVYEYLVIEGMLKTYATMQVSALKFNQKDRGEVKRGGARQGVGCLDAES
jgi:hypothetical protein